MGKKTKVPTNPKPQSMSESVSSNFFSKLFGHTADPDADVRSSLFSTHNPFRRKHDENPSQTSKEPGSGLSDQNPKELAGDSPDGGTVELAKKEEKKKKRAKEEIEGFDVDKSSGDAAAGNKSKRKVKGPEFDARERVGEEIPDLGLKVDADSAMATSDGKENEKKKTKRKRDELEREYEEKKYGAVADNEGSKEKVVGKKRKSAENPAEMMVSKEGYDDETKLLRTIFVGNLPLKIKKKALLKEFSQFGEVESVRLRSVPTLDSKKPKKVKIINNKINEAADSVHAYIVFKTEQSVEASLAHNMAVVGGKHIRVDRACPPRKKLKGEDAPLYDTKRTIFVGNLPFDVKDEELYRLFSGINQVGSSIEAIRVVRDSHTSLGKGIAYVLLKTREAANLIAKRRNLKLRDRELRVCHVKSNSTPTKRKIPSVDGSDNSSSKKRALEPRTPASGYRPSMKAPASYEGLRASKSGTEKKARRKAAQPVVFRSGSGSGSKSKDDVKQRKHKRPAVAARKARANVIKAGGNGSKQAGKKRKMGSRTPRSSYQKSKKAKKAK